MQTPYHPWVVNCQTNTLYYSDGGRMKILITALIIPVRRWKGWWVWVPARKVRGGTHPWDGKALSKPGAVRKTTFPQLDNSFLIVMTDFNSVFFKGSCSVFPVLKHMPFKLLALICYGSLTLVPKPLSWPRQNQLHSLASAFISE